MKTVSVSELKSNLSRFLREVRRGGEVQILDRGVPVARLTGLPAAARGEDENRRQRLIQAGVLRPGSGNARAILSRPLVEIPTSLSEAVEEERRDRV
jgi:prevent-host-death family protein